MDRTIVITGASDGIGAAAARQLSSLGERVVVVGRSAEKTAAVARETGSDHLLADFTRLDDVRRLAADLADRYPVIDVLANNAGGIFGDPGRTVDGFEHTFQVNHLAPFLLTNLLMGTLLRSRATVVNTSSVAAKLFGRLDLDDLDNDRDFSANKAYGDSKLENILFARGLHQRYHEDGLSAAAFHPGIVATSFADHTTSALRFVYRNPLLRVALTSPDKGADTLVWLAQAEPGREWASGEFYEHRRIAATNEQAYDDDLVRGLWERSAALVGLEP
jgi:NAD(P)-dependent dehydrogenase (short-subunit alcohol dehydrogenase family)